MSTYDLTHEISQCLDRHLVFPLLQFLELKEIYSEADLMQGKIDLLSKTNMVDFAMDIHKQLHNTEDVPKELKDKREVVVENLKSLHAEVTPLIELLNDDEVLKQLRQDKLYNLQFLQQHYENFKPEMLDTLFDYAKFQFDCGNYSGAAEYLCHFRILSTDPEKNFAALWGKFAAEILMQNWEGALEDMNRLKETIDSKSFASPLELLQQRTWLIHWSLFVFFNHPKGGDGIIDMFFQPQYINTIQTTCPHILRYLTTAVITNKRRRNVLKDLVKVIKQEGYTYRDPITEFLECLYVNFDFDGAQQKLRECETVLFNDFFLVACHEEFMENARMFIFETYCRIHQVISIDMLAEKLNMSPEEAEKWIVNLIRNARFDAKIDSKQGHVIMGTQISSIYQQVIEKTKGLSFRSNVMANNIEKKYQHGGQNQQVGRKEAVNAN
eukprot:Nk52_evm3s539 gene=Nk52_evmTU3s539